jgi:hypothetical protein
MLLGYSTLRSDAPDAIVMRFVMSMLGIGRYPLPPLIKGHPH